MPSCFSAFSSDLQCAASDMYETGVHVMFCTMCASCKHRLGVEIQQRSGSFQCGKNSA